MIFVIPIAAGGVSDIWVVETSIRLADFHPAQVVPRSSEEMHLEVASEVSGGVGAIYLLYFEEEAEEKLVRGNGLESIFRSNCRYFLDIGYGLLESKLALIECPEVSLKHVGP